MDEEKVFAMTFSKVYPLLVAKAERKGRTRQEVDTVTSWLTGYSVKQIDAFLSDGTTTYGDFFSGSPSYNPCAELVTGSICGVKISEIQNPLMKRIRVLDKLVDELAKGKPMEKILRK